MPGKAVVVERKPHALYCDDVSLTKQSFKPECDINGIMARAVSGAAVSHLNSRVPVYLDVSNVPDYRASLEVVSRANGHFMSLSAEVRRFFGNDPAKFVSFVIDPKNREESIRLGLCKAPKEPVVGPLDPVPGAVVEPVIPGGPPGSKAVPVVAKEPPKAPLAGATQ